MIIKVELHSLLENTVAPSIMMDPGFHGFVETHVSLDEDSIGSKDVAGCQVLDLPNSNLKWPVPLHAPATQAIPPGEADQWDMVHTEHQGNTIFEGCQEAEHEDDDKRRSDFKHVRGKPAPSLPHILEVLGRSPIGQPK